MQAVTRDACLVCGSLAGIVPGSDDDENSRGRPALRRYRTEATDKKAGAPVRGNNNVHRGGGSQQSCGRMLGF
jgi:hypothetical protein